MENYADVIDETLPASGGGFPNELGPKFNFHHWRKTPGGIRILHRSYGKASCTLCWFISCLGLYALAAYMASNRIKEIGVRKVLGASVTSITTLLSKDFLKLVLVSFVIVSPIAWWMMHSWLNNYPYRVNISWWIFALTGSSLYSSLQ